MEGRERCDGVDQQFVEPVLEAVAGDCREG
jgi:hypothetical protein